MNSVALLALDWGTSNLRACLLDAKGQAIEHRSAPGGVMAVVGGAFEQALLSLCSRAESPPQQAAAAAPAQVAPAAPLAQPSREG